MSNEAKESTPLAAEAFLAIQQKYTAERDKRVLPLSVSQSQYLDLNLLVSTQASLARFNKDPWLTPASNDIPSGLYDGARVKHLILGAGLGGLLAGVKLTSHAHVDPSDIYTVDIAGGWGGTWYWNRYPGLMCDVTSYTYLPLLRETGYMPKHRYSYGAEIREHVERVVETYGLNQGAMFRTKMESARWDDDEKRWTVRLRKERDNGDGVESVVMTVHSQFLCLASGLLVNVKLPNVEGLLDYQGHIFHTSRWDYEYTGGDPRDPHPQLPGLEGKRVGVIGTGATAVQLIPEVAKFAKELYVFQRTPSALNERGQAPTDVEWWQTNIQDPNWLPARRVDFSNRLSGKSSEPGDPIINDDWVKLTSYRTNVGGEKIASPDEVPAYVGRLHTEDLPHAERIRQRVDEMVKDPATAEKLKAWYPSWCKRPCFHDDYLPTFNQPHVHLVDTDGKGLDAFTGQGIVANGTEYPLDLVIVSTGFRAPAEGFYSARANMELIGRDGKSFDQKWKDEGVASLHGLMTRDFPNLFLFGPPFQAAANVNYSYGLDIATDHMAYIITEAEKRVRSPSQEKEDAAAPGTEVNGVVDGEDDNTHPETRAPNGDGHLTWSVEPTEKVQQDWTAQILMRAMAFAGTAGCTPSYMNGEGAMDQIPMEERMKQARSSPWGEGIEDYRRVVGEWEADGKLEGLEIVGGPGLA